MKTEGWPLKTAGHMEWGPRDNNWSFWSVLAVTNLKGPMQSMSSRDTFQRWGEIIKEWVFFGICKQSAIRLCRKISIHQAVVYSSSVHVENNRVFQ